jgi:Rad3-related DNA helicase
MALGDPWAAVPGAGDDTFAYTARDGVPEWRLATTPDVTAAINAFSAFSLPEAILKFRQGVGRLIRTKTDTGIVVILDNRVLTKRYGKAFLESVPPCPMEIV